MNLDVALSAVPLGKHKTETKVAVGMPVKNAKCSLLFVLHVEKRPQYLSNRLRIDLFIAENAMYHQHVTTIKTFIYIKQKPFPGLIAGEGFLATLGGSMS